MIIAGDKIIDYVAKQIGISGIDLLRESLLQYVQNQLKYLDSELFVLKTKYQIETLEEFENLYTNGLIDEEDTWKDFQKFDNLVYKTTQLQELVVKLNDFEQIINEQQNNEYGKAV